MTRLYSYGIFRSRETLERVIGHKFLGEYWREALPGYSVADGFGCRYAYEDPHGAISDGVMIVGLTEEDVAGPIDRVEGTESRHYDRIVVKDQSGVECYLYVAGPDTLERIRSQGGAQPTPPPDPEGGGGGIPRHRQPDRQSREEETVSKGKRGRGRAKGRWLADKVNGNGKNGNGKYDAIREAFPPRHSKVTLRDFIDPTRGYPEPAGDPSPKYGEKGELLVEETTTTRRTYKIESEEDEAERVEDLIDLWREEIRQEEEERQRRRTSGHGVQKLPEHLKGQDLPLVAYGNLCFRQTLEDRIGHGWPGEYEPARIEGFRITRTWPRYMVPAKDEEAAVFLLPQLTEEDLKKIDLYEGVHSDHYHRKLVEVEGRTCWAYVQGPKGRARMEARLKIAGQTQLAKR